MDADKITDLQLAEELAAVLSDSDRTRDYMEDVKRYEGYGSFGPMTPATRPAFIETFGLERVAGAENSAQALITEDAKKWENTTYYRKCIEANDNEKQERMHGTGQSYSFIPQVGNFIWGLNSGLEDGGGLPAEVRAMIMAGGEPDTIHPLLCEVEQVVPVAQCEFKEAVTADEVVRNWRVKGGSIDYDDGEKFLLKRPSTYVQRVAVVVAPDGRWFMIDPQGFDYARYIYLPVSWRVQFAGMIDNIQQQIDSEKAEAKRQDGEQKAAREKKYRDRCARWESIMQPVGDFQISAIQAAEKFGYESKEAKTARAQALQTGRKNILAMLNKAFPDTKFSVRKANGWHESWVVSWEGTPARDILESGTDLDLFTDEQYESDPYSDYGNYRKKEFTSFARKFMAEGARCEIVLNRE